MNGVPWTNHEEALLRALYPSAAWIEIERRLDRHPRCSIQKKAGKLGLRRRRTTKQSPLPVIRDLWRRREQQGLTRDVLGEIVGYHPILIGRWERGEACPSLHRLIDWCNALDLELRAMPCH